MVVSSYGQIGSIPLKSLVHFKEYELDRHDNKKLKIQVDGELFTVIPPEDCLNNEFIALYYKGVSEESYPSLSYSSFIRLVLIVGTDKNGMPAYKTVELNPYYMLVRLQEVEYEENHLQQDVTNYILGFNSYEFGTKFKE